MANFEKPWNKSHKDALHLNINATWIELHNRKHKIVDTFPLHYLERKKIIATIKIFSLVH